MSCTSLTAPVVLFLLSKVVVVLPLASVVTIALNAHVVPPTVSSLEESFCVVITLAFESMTVEAPCNSDVATVVLPFFVTRCCAVPSALAVTDTDVFASGLTEVTISMLPFASLLILVDAPTYSEVALVRTPPTLSSCTACQPRS